AKRISPPASEKYQNTTGITDLRARSEAIHWTRKRPVNMSWPNRPKATHQNSVPLSTWRMAKSRSILGPLPRTGFLLPPDEPHHPEKVDRADKAPLEVAVMRAARVAWRV